MSVDTRLLEARLKKPTEKLNAMIEEAAENLKSGGGGGTSGGMEERVTRLETHMEYVRRDLGEIRGVLSTVATKLDDLPTKRDLETWRWQWVGIALFVVTLSIGGIAAGLSLIVGYLPK
jgi:hypothetical protein